MPHPSQVIIFGATGDLTSRKLVPALASLVQKGKPPEGFSIVGVARRPKNNASFRAELRAEMPPAPQPAAEQDVPYPAIR